MDRRDFLKCTLTLAALAPLARLTAQTGAAGGAAAGTEESKLTRRRFRDTDLTLPLLGFPRADDCSLRFTSAEVAHELIGGFLQADGLR